MNKLIISILIVLSFQAAPIHAQVVLDPDKHTTTYLDLVRVIPNEALGLGNDVDLVFESDGKLAIVDPENQRVIKIDLVSNTIESRLFDLFIGKNLGKPRRISHANNRYWVADPDRHEVANVDENNKLYWHIKDFDSPFDKITDISTTAKGSLIVLDDGSGTVFQVKPNGQIQTIFKAPETKDRNWVGITSLDSTAVVADSEANAIWLIDPSGRYKKLSLKRNEIVPMDLASIDGKVLILDRIGRLWEMTVEGRDLKEHFLVSSFLLEPLRVSAANGRIAIWDGAKKSVLLFNKISIITAYQHLFMGEELLEIGLPSSALKELGAARALGNESTDLWKIEGWAYYELKEYDKAKNSFLELIRLSPDNLEARLWLGNCLLRLKNFENAIGQFNHILTQNPQHVAALTNIGNAYASLGKIESAEEYFTQAVRLNPESVEANLSFSKWLIVEHRFQKAVYILKEFLGQKPESLEASHYLGIAYAHNAQCQNAIPYLKKASQTGPFFTEALFILGKCYLALGNVESASGAFNNVLKIKPSHPDAINELNKIRRQN